MGVLREVRMGRCLRHAYGWWMGGWMVMDPFDLTVIASCAQLRSRLQVDCDHQKKLAVVYIPKFSYLNRQTDRQAGNDRK